MSVVPHEMGGGHCAPPPYHNFFFMVYKFHAINVDVDTVDEDEPIESAGKSKVCAYLIIVVLL